MNLAMVVSVSTRLVPSVAVVSPLAYQVLPCLLNTVIRVPAGSTAVSRICAVAPSTLTFASRVCSAAGPAGACAFP